MKVGDTSERNGAWWWAFGGLVMIAAFVRLYALDRYPVPVNHDELSNVYDGWSIAETGADRSGRRWPIICYGFGPADNRPAMFAWLCAGVSKWTGLSVVGCRAVAGGLGVLSVILAAIWGRRVLGRHGALILTAMLAVDPWHVSFSRSALEGTVLPGLFTVLILLSFRAATMAAGTTASRRLWKWALTALIIGLSTNAYGASRVSALVWAAAVFVILVVHLWISRDGVRQVLTCVVVFVGSLVIGAGPQIYAYSRDPVTFMGRSVPVFFEFFSVSDAILTFASNFVANLNPHYLFLEFGIPNKGAAGRCTPIALPFFFVGIVGLVWPGSQWSRWDRMVLLVAIVACISPAAVTKTNPHALRASGCAVLFPMIVVLGMMQGGAWVRWMLDRRPRDLFGISQSRLANVATATAIGMLLIFGAYHVRAYTRSPELIHAGQQPEWVELGLWLGEVESQYDRVCIEPSGNGWDLYVAAFSGMTPREFQSADREVWGRFNEFCVRLNQYDFIKRDEAVRRWERTDRKERWLVTDAHRSFVLELGGSDE